MRSRTIRFAAMAASVLVFMGCNEKTTSIKTLLDDPARFDGQTVRIAGEVREAAGALGFGRRRPDREAARHTMSKLLRGLAAGWGAKKLGGNFDIFR
ncbi:MAG: hypothetical protein Q8Q14_05035 [Gemmatimonadales bacterium]|nr:hypothetical protein [Gemmatimonadales bacterium]